jgi:hypothetical protein
MKSYPILLVWFVGLLAGCDRPVTERVNPDQAGDALRTALTAWKDGKTPEELEAQQPSIIMNEEAWRAGNSLLEFTLDPAGTMDGRQVRWVVQIKLRDKSGKETTRKATYTVDTIPRIVIVRDPFAQ